jgi:pimeloyl-ACP methyl ester carboxylesterase
MGKLASHTVDLAAGGQHYLAGGSGAPLFFLHGVGAIAASWSAAGEALCGEYRVVIPDLAGHGASAPRTGKITFAMQLEALEAILHAEAAEPAVLVGHSLGGWLSCVLTLRHPELVRCVVLVNGPLLLPWPEGLSLLPNNRAEAARLFAATSSSTSAPVGDAMLDAYIAYARTGPIGRFVFDLEAWKPYFLDDRLQHFPRPVDLIWGMDDELVSFANAEILLARLPNVRVTRLEGCGHLPHIDCPQRFMEALRAALARTAPERETV